MICGVILAQGSSGSISGRIVDQTGSGVPGAEVRLQNEVIQDSRTFTSGANGDFLFVDIQPGTYSVTVKASGFKELSKTGLQLTANDVLAAGDLKLQLGTTNETIEVKADITPVQSASAERSATIDSKQVMDLMARGRDVMAMLQILPGVINDNTGSDVLGQFTTPTMDGTRAEYNALNIDGISGNTARGKNAQSPINLDSIGEVKVLANSYSAEYGTAGGAIINIVTKTGTRDFHGSVYYYTRNEDFNANDFFNNQAGIVRPRYRFNTEGAYLGGPIYIPHKFNRDKQKLFFFFSQEYDPNVTPNSISNFTVPTALERQGDFSQSFKNATTLYTVKDPTTGAPFPGNVIPQSRMDPNSAKLLSVFPLPNATNVAITKYAYNFQVVGSEDQPVKTETLRTDYNATDKARFWFKASGYSSHNSGLNSPAINNKWGPAPVDYAQTMPQLGGSFTYVFTPTVINEVVVGMNLWTEDQNLTADGLKAYQRATYGINIPQTYPKDNPDGLLPAMSFGGVSSPAQVSYDGRFPMVDDSTAYSISDNLSKVWNNHWLKVGFLFQHIQYNQYHQAGGNSFPGSFNFGTSSSFPQDTGYAYANAFLGNYQTYTEATNRVDYAPITPVKEWYITDHWKVTNRLTVDIGNRFTYSQAQQPANTNAGNFVPYTYNPAQAPVLYRPAKVNGANVTINPLTGQTVPSVYAGLIVPNTGNALNGIVTPTTAGFPASMVYDNGLIFAPRLGIAWDPFGNGKTAVRLGGGVFYAGHPDAGTLGNLFFNPPAIYTPTQYYGMVATAANGTGLLSPSSFSRDIDPHQKVVTTYHANFEIQRDIGFGTVVTAAYVGSFGRHLGEKWDLNTVPYGAEFLPQNQNPQSSSPSPLNDNYFRPYMGYGSIPQQIFVGNSSYHSLQLQINRRFSHGLQYGVVYTRSKAMDYSEGDSTTSGGVARYNDWKVWNYGIAGYDRPNVLTFHFLYDVPKLSRLVPNSFVKAVFDGWQISDITSFISGSPMSVSMGTSPSVNFTGGGDGARPLMVGNPVLSGSKQTFYSWFNQAAYAEPTPLGPLCPATGCAPVSILNIGDAATTQFRGPGVNNWNTAVYKDFSVGREGRFHFQLRGEAYNTFNHTQFDGVDTTITYNGSGVNTRPSTANINSSRNPRYLQLALKLRF